jgi:hypothetical protein
MKLADRVCPKCIDDPDLVVLHQAGRLCPHVLRPDPPKDLRFLNTTEAIDEFFAATKNPSPVKMLQGLGWEKPSENLPTWIHKDCPGLFIAYNFATKKYAITIKEWNPEPHERCEYCNSSVCLNWHRY